MTIIISAELSHICPLEEITAHAAALETYGFDRVWVPDTVVSPWEAWLAACLIMQQTERLRIGLGVTNPYTRHPVVVAQMAATMQRQSRGRLAISLGKGIGRFLEKAGIRQQETAVEEYVTLLRGLIAGERTSLKGNAFHIDAVRLRTRPPDSPVPIYVAAIGASGWESAMRIADGVATIWNDTFMEMRRKYMREKVLPVAVMIPFSLTRTDFFANRVASLDELEARVDMLEQADIDEVIVAYGDTGDLEAAARLLKKRTNGRFQRAKVLPEGED